MSRPSTSGLDEELMSIPKKYEGLNKFMSDRPLEIPRDIVAKAFHVMDTDKDVRRRG